MNRTDFLAFKKHILDSWLAGTRSEDAVKHFHEVMKIRGDISTQVFIAAEATYNFLNGKLKVKTK